MNTLPLKDPAPCIVHSFCTSQALEILINDHSRNAKLMNIIKKYLEVIDKGNSWCDEGFRNLHHFYHPKTGKGLMGLYGADSFLADNIVIAKKELNFSKNNFFFYIGAALHLIQDLCVPHHALGYLLKGHADYEEWVLKDYRSYSVNHGANYNYTNPMDILNRNALKALEYSDLILNSSENNKIEATKELLGLAQKTSASFLHLIIKDLI